MSFWTDYKNTFPARYIELGDFDAEIAEHLKEFANGDILDVGGGIDGTQALKEAKGNVYLLDPNIPEAPLWMKGKIDWKNRAKFDMIVLRGSVNYLPPILIRKLIDMLRNDGLMIANTFVELPEPNRWIERSYSTIDGKTGVEAIRYNPKNNKITHILTSQDGNVIKHDFWGYTQDDYQRIIPGVQIRKRKSNSATLIYRKSGIMTT